MAFIVLIRRLLGLLRAVNKISTDIIKIITDNILLITDFIQMITDFILTITDFILLITDFILAITLKKKIVSLFVRMFRLVRKIFCRCNGVKYLYFLLYSKKIKHYFIF